MENKQAEEKTKGGFVAMDPDTRRQIAANGGRLTQEPGGAHVRSTDEAKGAGRKAGKISAKSRFNRSENDGRDYIL